MMRCDDEDEREGKIGSISPKRTKRDEDKLDLLINLVEGMRNEMEDMRKEIKDMRTELKGGRREEIVLNEKRKLWTSERIWRSRKCTGRT